MGRQVLFRRKLISMWRHQVCVLSFRPSSKIQYVTIVRHDILKPTPQAPTPKHSGHISRDEA